MSKALYVAKMLVSVVTLKDAVMALMEASRQ